MSTGESDRSRRAAARALGAVLDRAAIGKLQRAGGDDLVAKLAALFLKEAPERFVAMRESRPKTERIRLAHGFKTNCRMMGADGMSQICQSLVEFLEGGGVSDQADAETAEYAAMVDGLEAAYGDVRVWVEEVRDAALRGESPQQQQPGS